ncbi:MAG: ArnT family glycosyltransferase [Gammaproteobacteria bacterium]
MSKDFVYRWGIFPLWLLLTTTLFFRNPIPIDETRYLSVAWEMWQRGDFLVPYLNGHTYSHKPPLLFWLFESGWILFGVNEWWPRLVGPLCALGNLILIKQLANKLWPDSNSAQLAPWVLIATLLWTLFATSTMFDILLTCCVLAGMLGLVEAVKGTAIKGWSLFALAIGLGILTKGPVILVHLLPSALLAVYWAKPETCIRRTWFVHMVLAILAGAAIALAWALPAASAGGKEYADAILWHQTADRTVSTKIHARPFYWYGLFLPLLVFPWITWPRLWQNLKNIKFSNDLGLRLCAIWLIATFLVFSAVPSKQIHYLIPMLPAFALICARLLEDQAAQSPKVISECLPALLIGIVGCFLFFLPHVPGLAKLNWVKQVEPWWGISIIVIATILGAGTWYRKKLSVSALASAIVMAVFIGFIFFFQYTGLQYNLRPAALKLKAFNEELIPTAYVGDYQGQLHFLGRLTEPLTVIDPAQIPAWTQAHPNGYLIYLEKKKPDHAAYIQPHREYWLVFRTVRQALATASE